ncbi:MAG: ABC transporter permease [Cyanobacteria bacterium REEB446]|nr:ABC transporter permease [Cyanobacteria bacterium REEB446]
MKNFQIQLSITILAILYGFVFFADYIAPYNPCEQNNKASYANPSKFGLDTHGIYAYQQKYIYNPKSYKKETRNTKQKIYLEFFTPKKLISTRLTASIHSKTASKKLTQRNNNLKFYILGTDQLGRDNFSRLIHGAKPSLTVGFLALLIAFPIGTLYGAISAYSSPFIDNILMRLAEAMMSFPSFYLLIILAALLPASLTNIERFALITTILSFTAWAGLSRVIRGILLSIKEENYVSSAKLMGASPPRIITQHLIPQSFSYLIVAATLSIPGFIIGESALSFLGFGINQPDPSWGNILSEAKELSNLFHRPQMLIYPSLLIFLVVYSYNVLGDYLRDKLDTQHL